MVDILKLDPSNSEHQLGLTAKSFALDALKWANDLAGNTNPGDPDEDLKLSIAEGNYGAAYIQIEGLTENYTAFSSLNFVDECGAIYE